MNKAEFLAKEVQGNKKEGPFEVGDVVKWNKAFRDGDKEYTYSAVLTDAGWYDTSVKNGGALKWEDLISRLSAKGVTSVYVAEAWAEVKI